MCWPTKTALWRSAPDKPPSCAWGMHRPRRWGAGEDTARAFCKVLRAPEGATRARPPWHVLLFAYLPYRQRIPAGDTAHRSPRRKPMASAAYPSHLATWRRGRCLSQARGGTTHAVPLLHITCGHRAGDGHWEPHPSRSRQGPSCKKGCSIASPCSYGAGGLPRKQSPHLAAHDAPPARIAVGALLNGKHHWALHAIQPCVGGS